MTLAVRGSALFRAAVLAAACCAAPGCTYWDTFVPEQPTPQVEVIGGIHIDEASGTGEGCDEGNTLLWGEVRNTGDYDLEEVAIELDAYDGADRLLGTWRVFVFNGDVTDVSAEEGTKVSAASTSLTIDQSGSFEACVPLAFGSVRRADYRTSYCYLFASEIVCE